MRGHVHISPTCVTTLWCIAGILLACSNPTIGYGTTLNRHDSSLVRVLAIKHWGAGIPGFDARLPTLVLVSSTEHTVTCGTSGVNAAWRSAAPLSGDVNVLVVVEAGMPGEGLGLLGNYEATAIAEDTARILQRFFDVSAVNPSAILICTGGEVVYRETNLSLRRLDTPEVSRRASRCDRSERALSDRAAVELTEVGSMPKPTVSTVAASSPSGGVRLQEGTDLLIEALTPVIDAARTTLSFIDPHRNRVRRFALSDGRELAHIEMHPRLGRFFKRAADSEVIWVDLELNGVYPASFQRLVSVRGDTVTSMCKVQELIGDRPETQVWRPRWLVVSTTTEGLLSVDSLPYTYVAHRPIALPSSAVLCVAPSDAFYMSASSDPERSPEATTVRDSLPLLTLIPRGGRARHLLAVGQLESTLGRRIRLNDEGFLAASGKQDVYYLDDVNRFLVRLRFDDNRGVAALDVVEDWSTASESPRMIDMVGTEQGLVTISSISPDDSTASCVMQELDGNGELMQMRLPSGIDPLSLHVLGSTPASRLMLSKDRGSRWTIVELPLVEPHESPVGRRN